MTRLLLFTLICLICLVTLTGSTSTTGAGGGSSSSSFGDEELSSLVDADLFLEDDAGQGSGHGSSSNDLETGGSGLGPDDEDNNNNRVLIPQTPTQKKKNEKEKDSVVKETPAIKTNDDVFENKSTRESTSSSNFFSQPGILAAIICGAIVGLLCAILLVMFIVYRMRKKDEGSYVLEDSKRTSSYGKSKEFFA